MDWSTLLFSGKGRFSRSSYWLVTAINTAVWFFVVFLSAVSGDEPGDWIWILVVPAILFSVVTSFTSSVKRLHDREKSGLWLLLFYGGPGVLDGISRTGNDGAGVLFQLLSAAVTIWALVEMGCLRGTTGPNSYGPDPLMDETTAAPAA